MLLIVSSICPHICESQVTPRMKVRIDMSNSGAMRHCNYYEPDSSFLNDGRIVIGASSNKEVVLIILRHLSLSLHLVIKKKSPLLLSNKIRHYVNVEWADYVSRNWTGLPFRTVKLWILFRAGNMWKALITIKHVSNKVLIGNLFGQWHICKSPTHSSGVRRSLYRKEAAAPAHQIPHVNPFATIEHSWHCCSLCYHMVSLSHDELPPMLDFDLFHIVSGII